MASLGDVLRRAREARGLSFEEAEEATKIRKKYLAALETETYADLPPSFYTRRFLRAYAQFLNLNPDQVVELYANHTIEPPLEPITRLSRPSLNVGAWLIVSGVILLLFTAGVYLYQENQAAAGSLKVGPVVELTPATPTPVPTATPLPTPTEAVPQSPTPTPKRPTPTPQPQLVVVPSVVDNPADEAETKLRNAGFEVKRQDEWNKDVPAGQVYQQNPAGGNQAPSGSPVTLMVSKGPQRITVPDVVGLPENEAKFLITQAGLTVNKFVNYQGHDQLPDAVLQQVCVGCVLSTLPRAGTPVGPKADINIAVRKD